MIRVDNISKSFDKNEALLEVSAVFAEAKTNLVIGRSGSGKTVLLKCLIGLLEPDSGDIWYGNDRFTGLDSDQQRNFRQQMGVVFQGGALFDSLTVEQNIRLPMDFFTDWTRDQKLERVNFCLQMVHLPDSNKLLPAELSGGMKKRVAIARAIALNPKYLFCDEPNSGLDPQTAIVIDNLIHEITLEFKITTVINTHDMNSVMEIGDNILFLSEGHKCWEGSREEILTSDNKVLNDFVFASELMKKFK
ncbi:MAG: ATP-binding cassette domain-containing protein [Porphyromonadaceae bacterium]|nr:MAG: ATP-binding cassette domain-containing protein [Porphyromonadaceae bacterium]